MLSGLKINTTGAFAAYLVVVLLGYFIIEQALISAKYPTDFNYLVSMKIKFVDEKNNTINNINDQVIGENLKIEPHPGTISRTENRLDYSLPSTVKQLYIKFPGFNTVEVNIDSAVKNDNFEINLGEILLQKNVNTNIAFENQIYNPPVQANKDTASGYPTPIGGPPVRDN
jgi:hypothetical protein